MVRTMGLGARKRLQQWQTRLSTTPSVRCCYGRPQTWTPSHTQGCDHAKISNGHRVGGEHARRPRRHFGQCKTWVVLNPHAWPPIRRTRSVRERLLEQLLPLPPAHIVRRRQQCVLEPSGVWQRSTRMTQPKCIQPRNSRTSYELLGQMSNTAPPNNACAPHFDYFLRALTHLADFAPRLSASRVVRPESPTSGVGNADYSSKCRTHHVSQRAGKNRDGEQLADVHCTKLWVSAVERMPDNCCQWRDPHMLRQRDRLHNPHVNQLLDCKPTRPNFRNASRDLSTKSPNNIWPQAGNQGGTCFLPPTPYFY